LEAGSSITLISLFFILKNKLKRFISTLGVARGMMLSVQSWEVPYLYNENGINLHTNYVVTTAEELQPHTFHGYHDATGAISSVSISLWIK